MSGEKGEAGRAKGEVGVIERVNEEMGGDLPTQHPSFHPSPFTLHPSTVAWAVALIAALVAPYVRPSEYGIVLMNQALIFALVVFGLNFVYGFGGVFSLAQAAYWGIGAYTSALLVVDAKMPFLVGFLGAAVVASLFGLLLGVPTLKLRSHYLTMATLAFAEAVRLVLMNFDPLTHGAQGIRAIPTASIGPIAFSTPYSYYYLNLSIVLAAMLATARFRASRLGRSLQATRDDEMAAGASGVNVTHARVLAFVLSALLAGIAGSLWAHFAAFISPETFDLFSTIRFVAMLLIGGAGTTVGPVVGAVLLTYLPEWLRFLEAWYMAVYGLSIVLILVFAPRGLVGVAERVVVRLAVRWRGNAEAVATDPVGRGLLARSKGTPGPLGVPRPGTGEDGRAPGEAPSRYASQHPTPNTQHPTHHSTQSSVPSPQSSAPSVLRTEKLTMAFGGLTAVHSVSISVPDGQVRGIIGPNGSGKTTFLNLVSGIYRPVSGNIYLRDEMVTNSEPARLVSRGVARTFQNIRLFPRLSVLDNVKVARYCRTRAGIAPILLGTPGTSREERRVEEEAISALEFVGLAHRAHEMPGDLPYGQQRLVEIARALATGPRLLLLDEPAAGMSLEEKRHLARLVRAVNGEQGISVIVIEHDMRIISGLCHQVTVLNFGEVIAEGTPDEVRGDEAVIEAYLGRSRRRAGTR